MIKIAIVDDNLEKIAAIRAVLENSAGITSGEIVAHTCTKNAAADLKRIQYDLLILDLNLPVDAGGTAEGGVGIRFFGEISQSKRFRTPKHVVFLTAFEDELAVLSSTAAGKAWQHILYKRGETGWQEDLLHTVRHVIAVEDSYAAQGFDYDCLFITALDKPELEALEAIETEWIQISDGRRSAVTCKTTLPGGAEVRFAAGAAPQMGCTSAAVYTIEMVRWLRPRLVIMCGIAAGIDGECQIGDVLAANTCWDWGAGKYIETGRRVRFSPAPTQMHASASLLNKLRSRSQTRDLIRKADDSWLADKPDRTPEVKIGPVVSGAAVIASAQMVGTIKKQHRKLIGIEMETYGVYYAAEASGIRSEYISLKAVCDFADSHKGDKYQSYAAHLSARFAFAFAKAVLAETS